MDTIKPEHERVKEESAYLRGSIGEELNQEASHFSKDAVHLLKFHGIYQQDDRDVRNERRKGGIEPLYQLMVRSKIPGGRLSANQYLAHSELAERYGNGTLRITSRQGLQFHGVLKKHVKSVIRGIADELGTTYGACGDVVRNVLTCPAPLTDPVRNEIYGYAKMLSDEFLPHSSAYQEIWINGEKAASSETVSNEPEPIYGKAYLPRKFKIAFAFPEDNCVDVYTNDIGIVPNLQHGKLCGFNLLVGGGLGMSHGAKDTFARLADPFCFIPASELAVVVKAIVAIQRDYGDRRSRKHARLKYLIHDRGLAWFKAQVEQRIGRRLETAGEILWKGFEDHLGWHEQGDGLWYFGFSIQGGRIKDVGAQKIKSGIAAIVKRFKTPVHLTTMQSLLICGIRAEEKTEFEKLVSDYGISHPDALSAIAKNALACPALPTCGLAITEAERVLPKVVEEMETTLKALGLDREVITLRMTGCPNACARPFTSEIGIVGKGVGAYNIYLGGSHNGERLNAEFAVNVPLSKIVETLKPALKLYREKRKTEELFGDFCFRVGMNELNAADKTG